MELTIGLLVLLGIVLAFLAAINHTIKQAEKEDKKKLIPDTKEG
ncbi:hypothetical protein [Avibacterium endocarditidis]